MKYKKICLCCNKEFETNSPQKLYCDRDHYLPCPICGKLVKKKDRDFTLPPATCSTECKVKAIQCHMKLKVCEICGDTFKPKSGVATICDKEHHINCEICGKDMIVTKKMWHDKITTCSKECAQEKLRRFYRRKYGVDHPMQNPEVQKHFEDAMKSKYGAAHALQIDIFKSAAQRTNLSKFDTEYACLADKCIRNNGKTISVSNKRFKSKLEAKGLTCRVEFKLGGNSYDIMIPESKTIIEIDPSYIHNSIGNHWTSQGLSERYHISRSEVAWQNGYRCIHVFDWDKEDLVINNLAHKQDMLAAHCRVYKLKRPPATKFLKLYNYSGSPQGQVLYLGLVHEPTNEIVQVMSFGVANNRTIYTTEIGACCTLPKYNVIGGYEKLFKEAITNFCIDSIVAYADLSKTDGSEYERMGMKRVGMSAPQINWSKGKRVKIEGDEELLKAEGWLPVYDCGYAVFEY